MLILVTDRSTFDSVLVWLLPILCSNCIGLREVFLSLFKLCISLRDIDNRLVIFRFLGFCIKQRLTFLSIGYFYWIQNKRGKKQDIVFFKKIYTIISWFKIKLFDRQFNYWFDAIFAVFSRHSDRSMLLSWLSTVIRSKICMSFIDNDILEWSQQYFSNKCHMKRVVFLLAKIMNIIKSYFNLNYTNIWDFCNLLVILQLSFTHWDLLINADWYTGD